MNKLLLSLVLSLFGAMPAFANEANVSEQVADDVLQSTLLSDESEEFSIESLIPAEQAEEEAVMDDADRHRRRWPRPRPHYWVCYARNGAGRVFSSAGWHAPTVQRRALRACINHSRVCWTLGCRRR